MGRFTTALALLACALPTRVMAADDRVEVVGIQARFVNRHSGTLSDDIMRPGFNAWNTLIGEGGATEPADDVLVLVQLASPSNQETYAKQVVDVVATGPGGRALAHRRFDSILTGDDGRTTVSLMVQDATCVGDLRIVVTNGASRMERTVSLPCGE